MELFVGKITRDETWPHFSMPAWNVPGLHTQGKLNPTTAWDLFKKKMAAVAAGNAEVTIENDGKIVFISSDSENDCWVEISESGVITIGCPAG
jgi:hypothetical protein